MFQETSPKYFVWHVNTLNLWSDTRYILLNFCHGENRSNTKFQSRLIICETPVRKLRKSNVPRDLFEDNSGNIFFCTIQQVNPRKFHPLVKVIELQ